MTKQAEQTGDDERDFNAINQLLNGVRFQDTNQIAIFNVDSFRLAFLRHHQIQARPRD